MTAPDACLFLRPIFFDEKVDSEETIQQIIDYLITYEALCNE